MSQGLPLNPEPCTAHWLWGLGLSLALPRLSFFICETGATKIRRGEALVLALGGYLLPRGYISSSR